MLLFGVRIVDGCMGEFRTLCALMDFTAFFSSVFLERLHDTTTSVPFGFAHDGALGRTRMLGSCLF